MKNGIPNLDGMTAEELRVFTASVWTNTNAVAIELFWSDRSDYLEAVDDLASYAMSKRNAMLLRAAGNIPEALRIEARCDEKYNALPKWARW